jgi:hypothetical protein
MAKDETFTPEQEERIRRILREELEAHERRKANSFGWNSSTHSHFHGYGASIGCGTDCALMNGPCGHRNCLWGGSAQGYAHV